MYYTWEGLGLSVRVVICSLLAQSLNQQAVKEGGGSTLVSGWTSVVTWNTVDTGLEFVLGCYRERKAQYTDGRVEEDCENKREQGRSRSHSGSMSCLVRTVMIFAGFLPFSF